MMDENQSASRLKDGLAREETDGPPAATLEG